MAAVFATGCGGGGDGTADAGAGLQSQNVAPLPEAVAADAQLGGDVTDPATLQQRRLRPRPPAPAPAPTPAPAPAPAPAPSPAPAPTPAPAPAPAPSAAATCNLPDFQAAILSRINQYRTAGASCRNAGQFAPTQPLAWNGLLQQAAAGHSQDMAARNYFSHTSQDGRSMVDRINATGYLWTSIGENIAAGQPGIDAVIDGWMASDGHCANIMNPVFRDAGLACVASTTSTYRTYWTMNSGKAR